MTEPRVTPAGEEQPMTEVDETLSRCAEDRKRLEGQVGEVARLLANLRRDQESLLDDNERLDRRLGALGQDVEIHRQAVAELENHLDDLSTLLLDENELLDLRLGAFAQDVEIQRQAVAELGTRLGALAALVRELAGWQAAGTGGERAIWWPDLPAGQERTAGLRLLGAWVDDVLRGHHPGLFTDSLQACWYRHDDVLDELTALRAAWYAAYRGTAAPATAAIEWHDRWLPGCMARCKAAIKARPCNRDGHQSPPGSEMSCDSVAFKDFTESGPGR